MSKVCKDIAMSNKEEAQMCFNPIKTMLINLNIHFGIIFKRCIELVNQYNSTKELSKEEDLHLSDHLGISEKYYKIDKTSYKLIRFILIEKRGKQIDLKVITSFLSFVFILGRISRRVGRIYHFLEDLKVSYYLELANF